MHSNTYQGCFPLVNPDFDFEIQILDIPLFNKTRLEKRFLFENGLRILGAGIDMQRSARDARKYVGFIVNVEFVDQLTSGGGWVGGLRSIHVFGPKRRGNGSSLLPHPAKAWTS